MAAQRLTEAALIYLEAEAARLTLSIDARVATEKQEPNARALEDAAFDAGERLEDIRRSLGDAIIRADPQIRERVRKIVKFGTE